MNLKALTVVVLIITLGLLDGCAVAPMLAGVPGIMGAVAGHEQASSLSESDADTVNYTLPKQMATETFVRDVRDTATATGFSVLSASSFPAPGGTMMMMILSKHHSTGLFSDTFITLNITLQPDGRTMNISSSVRGGKDVKPGAVISDFRKSFEEKSKT